MDILAKKHIETRFIKVQAEKSPFLAERLKIVVLPTLALIKKAKVDDYVVGCINNLFVYVLWLLFICEGFLNSNVVNRWDLISLVGQMSSVQRNWRRG